MCSATGRSCKSTSTTRRSSRNFARTNENLGCACLYLGALSAASRGSSGGSPLRCSSTSNGRRQTSGSGRGRVTMSGRSPRPSGASSGVRIGNETEPKMVVSELLSWTSIGLLQARAASVRALYAKILLSRTWWAKHPGQRGSASRKLGGRSAPGDTVRRRANRRPIEQVQAGRKLVHGSHGRE